MASGGDDLVAKFEEFCTLSGGKKNEMQSKAVGKMVKDCLEKDYKKYDVKSICDASVFPTCKEKGKPYVFGLLDNNFLKGLKLNLIDAT